MDKPPASVSKQSNDSSMEGGNSLMDDIYDQFLLCKICYEIYKRPKTLVCLHTFCADCLEKHQDAEVERSYRYMLYSRAISCPICRKKTELPSGGVRRLPDNFLVENLIDVVNRSKPSNDNCLPCEICKPAAGKRLAISKCLDCSKLLCVSCVELHKKTKVTEGHSIFDIEVEKDIKCKVHADEVVRFYCEPCEVCICILCTFQEHKGHEVSSFQEGIDKYSHGLDVLMEACRQRIAALKDRLHLINRCEGAIKKNEQHIREMAIDSIAAIRKKEKQMTVDLREMYGQPTLEFMKNRDEIQDNIETLQSTCNLTDIILKDKSIEILLLRKEIQEKINALLATQPDVIPDNILKDVKFVPGNFAFGYLDFAGSDNDGEPNGKDNNDDGHALLALKQSLLQSIYTQTEKWTRERSTTMDTLAFKCDIDQPTQTDIVEVSDAGVTVAINSIMSVMSKSAMATPESRDNQTMTIGPVVTRKKTQTEKVTRSNQMTWTTKIRTFDQSVSTADLKVDTDDIHESTRPSMSDSQTMTPQTPTMPRKMQTESVQQSDQTTTTADVMMNVIDKFTNTQNSALCDKGTLTKKNTFSNKRLSTNGLITYQSKETCTPEKRFKVMSTITDHITHSHRSTLTQQLTTSDKNIGTRQIECYNQESNTPVIHNMDVGVTARCAGTDASTGTRNIVLSDIGSGEHHALTTDTGTDPWMDVMPNNDRSHSIEKLESEPNELYTKMKHVDPETVHNQDGFEKSQPLADMSIQTDPSMPSTCVICEACKNKQLSEVGTETNFESQKDVNDASTSTERVTTKNALTSTFLQTKSKGTATMTKKTKTVHAFTDNPCLQDGWNDVYRGLLKDSACNTDDVVVKSWVNLTDCWTNTQVSHRDRYTCMDNISQVDEGCEDQKAQKSDSSTSMSSFVETAESSVGTDIQVVDAKCGDSITTGEISTMTHLTTSDVSTETKTQMRSRKTSTEQVKMADQACSPHQLFPEYINTASDVIHIPGEVKSTETEALHVSDVSTGMIPISMSSKSTATMKQDHKDSSTSTFVPVVEKATYMPNVITMDSSTSPMKLTTSNKKMNTMKTESDDVATMTTAKKTTDNQTSMGSEVKTGNIGTATDVIATRDSGVDTEQIKTKSRGIGTKIETSNSQTNTVIIDTKSESTTTGHSVVVEDKLEGNTVVTYDAETSTEVAKMKSKGTHIFIESSDKSVMKKPRMTTRGTHGVARHTLSQSTSTVSPDITSTSCMTDRPHINDKAVNVIPEGRDESTSTVAPTVTDREMATDRVYVDDRAISPLPIQLCDAGCDPDSIDLCEKQCSPVKFEVFEQGSTARPETMETSTYTDINMQDQATNTNRKKKRMRHRMSSPIDDSLLFPKKEACTHMDAVQMSTRASSPIITQLETSSTNTDSIECVDRESTPIPVSVREQGVHVQADVQERGVNSVAEMVERGVGARKIVTLSTSTSTPHVKLSDKETTTSKVHVHHKNISTENTVSTDKGTMTTSKVESGYLDNLKKSSVVTVCRGTVTDVAPTKSTETSTNQTETSDKGSSPLRTLTSDKSTMATKGEIIEPVDTFQAPNVQRRPKRPIFDSPRSSLEIITEEAKDSSSEEDSGKKSRMAKSRSVGSLPFHLEVPSPKRTTRNEAFFGGVHHRIVKPIKLPQMSHASVSTADTTEAGTNTKGIDTTSCGTSTLNIDTADKAICTEAVQLNGKMVECINKLKNVRQRLEPPSNHPVYVTATSLASSTPSTTQSSQTPTRVTASPMVAVEEAGPQPAAVPMMRHRRSPINPESEDSSCSDSDQPSPRKHRLARQKRLNINELLSTSLPENKLQAATTPPKLTVRTVQRQVIPKLEEVLKTCDTMINEHTKSEDNEDGKEENQAAKKIIEGPPTPERPTQFNKRDSEKKQDLKPQKQSVPPPKPPRMKPPEMKALQQNTEQKDQKDVKPKINPKIMSPKEERKKEKDADSKKKEKEKSEKKKSAKLFDLPSKSPSLLRKFRKNSEPSPLKVKPPKKQEKKQVQASYDVFKELLFGRTKPDGAEDPGSKSLPPTPKLTGRKNSFLSALRRDKHKESDSDMTSSQDSSKF